LLLEQQTGGLTAINNIKKFGTFYNHGLMARYLERMYIHI
jgi:hypothetical protein